MKAPDEMPIKDLIAEVTAWRDKGSLDSYIDLSSLPEDEKEKAIREITILTAKPLLSAFLSFGLKTHIETMVVNDLTGKEYVLTFETIERFRERFNKA